MKRPNRGRGSSGKKGEKEIRNARGLRDILTAKANPNTPGSRELNEFVASRRKGKAASEPQSNQIHKPNQIQKQNQSNQNRPNQNQRHQNQSNQNRSNQNQRPNPNQDPKSQFRSGWESQQPDDEVAEDHAAPRGGAAGEPPMFFWSANGPVRRPGASSDTKPGSGTKPEAKGGNLPVKPRAVPPSLARFEPKEEEAYDDDEAAEEFDNEYGGEEAPAEPEHAPSVYNRARSAVQGLFRTSDRLRSPVEDETKKSRKLTPELENKFEDSEEETDHGRRGKKKAKKDRRGQSRHGSQPKAPEPVYFDDRRSGKDRRGQPTQAKRQGEANEIVEGIVKRHPDGFGFVIQDDPQQPDVYVPRNYMTGVMTNDRVRVEVYSSRHADRTFGEIKEIIKHAYTRIVGAYLPVDQKYGLILGEGKGWGYDMKIAAKDSMGAKEGDIVAVEVISYPGERSEFVGKVVEIIGDLDEPLNDIKRVIFSQGIPNQFSAEALRDARKFGAKVTEKEIKGRTDLRTMPLITIDGATARDFDDAIYVLHHNDGFKLWVAIADVSHYVKPGTKLDEEAYERGTSTYFPNFVVPMLPEELSNDLCSLNPNVDRLCFVCEMDIDFQGHISEYKFYEAVMRSQARVTYGEAQEVIDGRTPPKLKHVAEHIRGASDLAKILMAKRYREGSLDLEIPETQVVVDEAGRSVDVIKSERLFAHRLIEEMMLAANICTARFMDEHQIPGIYRIHEEPFEDNIKALQRFLFNFGGNPSMSGGKLQKKITRALQAFEGKPEAQVLNILTLRSMQQAKYSANNVGHFGLGFSHYSHFTSPIRRYPDLIAHRLIKSQIYKAYEKYAMDESELQTAATMLSGCEQRSVKAERQVVSIKKARFIKQFEGEEFDGLISSVAKFGVFVLLRPFDIDGLVKIESLGDDRFIFDEDNLRLVGKRTGINYSIGDAIRIEVVSADAESGKIEFKLAGETEASAPHRDSKKNRKHVQKRGKTENDSRRVRKERVSKRRRKT